MRKNNSKPSSSRRPLLAIASSPRTERPPSESYKHETAVLAQRIVLAESALHCTRGRCYTLCHDSASYRRLAAYYTPATYSQRQRCAFVATRAKSMSPTMTCMELVRDTGSVVPEESAQADVSYLVGDVQGKSRGRTGALQQQHPSGTSVSSYNAMMRPEASGLRLLYATLDDMAHSEYSRISRIPQRLWYPAGSSSARSSRWDIPAARGYLGFGAYSTPS